MGGEFDLTSKSVVIQIRVGKAYLWHLVITEFVPEIFNSIKTNKASNEESNPLHTANTPNAQTSQRQPSKPLQAEAVFLQSMEPSPAKDRCKCKAQKHRIEKNESADCSIRVLTQNHQRNEPNSWSFKVHLAGSIIGQRDADGAEEGVESSHHGIVEFLRIFLPRFELERSIVARQVSR
jgi:hypothetical protein